MQEFLATHDIEPKDVVDAKAKLGRKDALRLARAASTVVVVKGKKVATFNMNKDRPTDSALADRILGPTGNLRAPTIRKGRMLFVGFHEDELAQRLGV